MSKPIATNPKKKLPSDECLGGGHSGRHFGGSTRKSSLTRAKTPWLTGLVKYYRDKHARDPNFKYSQAMKEYSSIYSNGGK